MASFGPRTIMNLARNMRQASRRSFSSSGQAYITPSVMAGSASVLAGVSAAFLYNKMGSNFQLFPVVEASAIKTTDANAERTFIMIKPDGVKRGLVANIIKRFEQRGYKLVAMKMMQPGTDLLNEHYADLKTKPFFNGLVRHITSGPVVAMVWEGKSVVKQGRQMLGETDPLKSKPGSIRGDYSIDMGRNIIHGSDSVESANDEINLWFKPEELMAYQLPLYSQVFE